MATVESAKAQLARRDQPAATQDGDSSVAALVAAMKPQIQRALPATLDADRFTRMVLTTLRTNPKLATCDSRSLLGACMLSAQLGLEPGPLGHSYFVPFRNKGRMEVTFIIGYRGMLELARRSGHVTSIEAREVCANDRFEFEFGLEPKLRHVPATGDRGEPTHYYGIARFVDGGHYFDVLSKADVDSYRQRSRASGDGPWVTDYAAMARKTVIRRMATYLPLSAEAARAVASDEGVVASIDDLDDTGDVQVSHDQLVVESQVREDQAAATDDVDSLRKPQLQKRLHQAGLDTTGKVDELRERLRTHLSGEQPDTQPADDGDAPTASADGGEAGVASPPSDGPPSPPPDPEPEPEPGPDPDPEPEQPTLSDQADDADRPPLNVDPDTGELWSWRDHADAVGVMHMQVVVALRDQLPGDVATPANPKGVDALVDQRDDIAITVHQLIEQLAEPEDS